MPRPLPDGTSLVYAVSRSGAANPASLSLVSLATGETTPLDVSAYAPLGTRGAWLLVERRDGVTGSIAAVPFDARRRRVGTTSVTLAQGLTFRTTVGLNASLADDGSLVYTRGVPGRRLAITDAGGAITATFPETRGFFDPHVSPDGRRVAVVVAEAGGADAPTADVWVYDVGSETPSRLTAGQLVRYVAWAPGGTRLVYVQNPVRGPSEIWTVSGDGSGAAERLYAAPEGVRIQSPPSYVDDGRAVIFEAIDQRTRRHEIWRVRLDSAGGAAGAPLLRSPFDLEDPQVSPDGRWLAYSSDETGQLEVYVRAYPALDRRVRISAAGGIAPTWASDGRRLFYQESETSGGLLAAAVAAASGSLAVTERREVLATSGGERPIAGWGDYDVRPGGAGFVLVRPVEERGQELVLVQHWDRELRARAGGR
ncbi:WD40-like beta Propeller containing protein (plasmid) [Gemmatirosa kalamazoonensis]|uniref:WD40-like beta Propeller containing protein n=1 Tax=Gemmatirosa kalamazoonensis TaxID=861299 RepID=W0RQX2_9BACT|nr:PD40 domain-containing protein [Gemmatirosa kalamazoonensis]AHG93111.1 WD40-like beta Propeller containing protein [Gemmatirosa kalamazoonensis]